MGPSAFSFAKSTGCKKPIPLILHMYCNGHIWPTVGDRHRLLQHVTSYSMIAMPEASRGQIAPKPSKQPSKVSDRLRMLSSDHPRLP